MSFISTFIASTPESENGVRLLFKGKKIKIKNPVVNPGVQQTASSIAQAEQAQLAQATQRNGLANTKRKRSLVGGSDSGQKTLLG